MDPFQRVSCGLHSFRAVPMTHLARPTENGWSVSLSDAGCSTTPASVNDLPCRGSTVLTCVDVHTNNELGNSGGSTSGVDNVRKWQQFGLRVTPPSVYSPLTQQLQQPHQLPGSQATNNSWQGGSAQLTTPYSYTLEDKQEKLNGASIPQQSINIGNYLLAGRPRADHAATTAAAKSASGTSRRTQDMTVVEIEDDDDGCQRTTPLPPPTQFSTSDKRLLRTLSALQYQSPSSPASSASVPPSAPLLSLSAPSGGIAAVAEDGQGLTSTSDAVRRLQITLASLSEKVQHSAEEQRCGPPKRNDKGGGGGRPQPWAAKHCGGRKKTSKCAKEKSRQHEYNDDANGGDITNDTAATTAPDADQTCSTSDGKKGKTTHKRIRADNYVSSKRGGKRKRAGAGEDGSGGPGSFLAARRTPFSFSTNSGGGYAENSLAGLSGAPTAAATVSVPFFYLQTSTEDLFNDVHRTLNDPDRIQAPPLFVGISTLASDGGLGMPLVECRTNFTFHSSASKTLKGRVSSCFPNIDPVYSHQHVELVFARWKDSVYALPAQTLGFPFLCRVLTELPGVELITFNAQAVLIALLAYCKGTLWSQCISDVRVMAWMAQLHVNAASSASACPQQCGVFAAAGVTADGGAGAADTDMNVLYDYDQLLLRVSAGKPPPSVLLEKASEADAYSSNSSVHTAGAVMAAGTSNTELPAPPLTPAQRLLAQHVYYLATVYRSLYGLLGSKGLLQAFLRQEKRIALLLALMRYNGVSVDLAEVHRYQRSCEAEMKRQRSQATALVPEMGDDFNIQSHDQCRRALYEVLHLGKYLTVKTQGGGESAAGSGLTITKSGRLSTAEETLRALAPHHEFPACLLKYRKASKLMQTYVEGIMSYAVARAEKTPADSAAAAAPNDNTSAWPSSNEHALLPAELQLLGETVDVNDAKSNPFVDRQLIVGRSGGGVNRHGRSAMSPVNARAHFKVDEEASVTTIGDLTLPRRGYATIHPNFLQEGTDTGRLSCVEPNLQNLPRNGATSAPATTNGEAAVEGGEGEEDLLGFRRCFVASPGFTLLSVDYQQIELRVLAHLCGDKALIDALTKSTDIHRAIAEVVFKKKPVSSEERTLAKRVVFGMLYGAGPKTLAAHMGVNVERALHITSLLTNAFPGIETYHRRVVEESRVNGFVRTISGRLRYLPDIHSTVMARRSYAERQAFNSVVQGSAADVMKMAMLAVAKDVLQRYGRDDVLLLSQIHDEMVFMVRKELLPTVVPIVSAAMSHAMHLLVPLTTTVKFGPSLGELQEWSVEHDLGLGIDD